MYPVLNTDTWFFFPFIPFLPFFPSYQFPIKLSSFLDLRFIFFPMEIKFLLGLFKVQIILKDSCYTELVQQNPTITVLSCR